MHCCASTFSCYALDGLYIYVGHCFPLVHRCGSENLVVCCIEEWEDWGKLVNNLEAMGSSHSLWGIASIKDSTSLLSDSSEWWISVNTSPECLCEQHGIVHSLLTSFIMKSECVCSLSGFCSLPNMNMPAQLQPALLHSSILALRDIPVTFKQTLG